MINEHNYIVRLWIEHNDFLKILKKITYSIHKNSTSYSELGWRIYSEILSE